MANKIALSPVMKKFVDENWQKLTNKEIAVEMKCSIGTVRKHCHASGLFRMQLEYFTAEQTDYLKQHFRTIGDKELAIIFNQKWKKNKGWTFKHIEKKRKYLGLLRTSGEIELIRQRNIKRGCFQNMSTWETRGQAPDGTVRVWRSTYPFKAMKVKGRWVHYAQWLYIATYGAFPPGHIVGFKDRDNMNVTPDNLEAITRTEHARRNRTLQVKYPDDLRALENMLSELNIAIKQKTV